MPRPQVAEAASAGAGGALEAQRRQAADGYLRAPSRPTTNHVGNAMAEAAVDLVLAELEGGLGEEAQQAARALPPVPGEAAAAGGGGGGGGERPSRARLLLQQGPGGAGVSVATVGTFPRPGLACPGDQP
jgi:hypothetical protein